MWGITISYLIFTNNVFVVVLNRYPSSFLRDYDTYFIVFGITTTLSSRFSYIVWFDNDIEWYVRVSTLSQLFLLESFLISILM